MATASTCNVGWIILHKTANRGHCQPISLAQSRLSWRWINKSWIT